MMSDLNKSQRKIPDFVSFLLFGFSLAVKLKNFDFGSHWNTLRFFEKKDMMLDLNMSHGKMSDFVLVPLFGFTLVIKQRSSNFESHWNTLTFFYQKIWCIIRL